jgi:hypothetical protein
MRFLDWLPAKATELHAILARRVLVFQKKALAAIRSVSVAVIVPSAMRCCCTRNYPGLHDSQDIGQGFVQKSCK